MHMRSPMRRTVLRHRPSPRVLAAQCPPRPGACETPRGGRAGGARGPSSAAPRGLGKQGESVEPIEIRGVIKVDQLQ